MLEAGIKPIYVFDGQPPDAKKEELARRCGGHWLGCTMKGIQRAAE